MEELSINYILEKEITITATITLNTTNLYFPYTSSPYTSTTTSSNKGNN